MRLSLEERALRAWREEWQSCTRCELHKDAWAHVPGEGQHGARLLVIGEAPGASEEMLDRPFIGPAGLLLRGILLVAGFRETDLFITNTVACRPFKNREPSLPEMRSCEPRIKHLTALLPHLRGVLLVGSVAQYYSKFFDKPVTKMTHPGFWIRQGISFPVNDARSRILVDTVAKEIKTWWKEL